jgi:hypothetical protein
MPAKPKLKPQPKPKSKTQIKAEQKAKDHETKRVKALEARVKAELPAFVKPRK